MVWQELRRRWHTQRRPPSEDAGWARGGAAPRRTRELLLVGTALVAALVLDWVLVPWPYPVAAAYGIALLLATHLLSPRGVAFTTCVALLLSVLSNNVQRAPAAAWLADNASLLGIGALAWLLARQREVARTARQGREAAQARVELAYEAARSLAEATSLEEAGSSMLAAIGRDLGWACGAVWRVDEADSSLACLATWHRPEANLDGFARHTREQHVERGVGLPGRVWTSRQPLWIADVQGEPDFIRRRAAVDVGLRSAFGFPIRRGDEILGVIEFFDEQGRQPDAELLLLLDALGAQIGLFLGRRQAEDRASALLESERMARREADTAVRTRDEFLASASHDMRGPLTAIRGYAALARRRMDAGETQAVEPALASIEAAARRLTAALDELLDVAQLQAGRRLALRRGPTDLVALVQRVAAEHQVATQDCRIVVRSNHPQLVGCWDTARLERALGNLVGNAVKYSPHGAEVGISLRSQHDARGAWAEVEIQDRGIGIPAADLPHIFERFHRATNVSDHLPGTGLGLAGAHEIIEQHDGEIRVQTEEGHGSTFTVRLPIVAGEQV